MYNQFMVMLKSFLLVCLLVSLEGKLYQVVSMFRHGARYAMHAEYDGNATFDKYGQLNAIGMTQHQKLGQLLNRDYIQKLGFLSKDFKAGQIEVFSTDVNRTMESALSQLYGIYGLAQGQKLPQVDKKYHTPPFSLNSDSKDETFALPQGYQPFHISIDDKVVLTQCKNFEAELQKNINYQINIYKEMNLTYYPYLKKMADIFNIPLNEMDFQKNSYIYDTLTVDRYLGRPLPSNFSDADLANMKHLHQWFNFIKITGNISRAINTGKLRKVLADFDDRISNADKTLKWTFLSCHDVDVSAMLQDLNIADQQCIEDLYRKGKTTALNCDSSQEYASNIIFQLHSDDGKKFSVRVRHDGKYVYLCGKKDVTCDYQDWKSRIMKVLVNIDTVCNGPE